MDGVQPEIQDASTNNPQSAMLSIRKLRQLHYAVLVRYSMSIVEFSIAMSTVSWATLGNLGKA